MKFEEKMIGAKKLFKHIMQCDLNPNECTACNLYFHNYLTRGMGAFSLGEFAFKNLK